MWPLNYSNTKVTVELGELVESGVKLWDFEYPSYYKGEAKTAFEQKVIDHYRFRQIGQETVGRFLHCFRTRIQEIMPYYLQLYKSQELMDSIEDPFGTVDITETFEETRTGTTENTSSGTMENTSSGTTSENQINAGTRKEKFSDTPQGTIDNLFNETHLTNATITEDSTRSDGGSETSGTSSGTTTGTESGTSSTTVRSTHTKKGGQGVTTYGHDIMEYRQSFLNIDLQIINELNDLFLMVY